MNLGIFLGIGESLKQMEKSGQKDRFINLYLKRYAKDFRKVYLFSYENESCALPENVIVVPNKLSVHRYLYSLLIPIVNHTQVNDCDIIRGFGLTSTIPAFLASKRFVFNLPYSYSEFLKVEKKYLLIPIFYILEKLAIQRASKILVATKQKLNNLTGSKFIYLPNGVDLTAFNRKGLPGKGVVFVGRLEKQKNLFFLIDAVSKLPSKMRKITFIGSGSLKTNLKEYASKKKVSLTLISAVDNLRLPKILERFSIFSLASFAEGSPKVLLEAMAVGLVPVVTNFSTAREIVQDAKNGFVTSYDINAYSHKLEILIRDNDLRSKMSKDAVQSISDNFNLEKLISQEIKILKSTAAK